MARVAIPVNDIDANEAVEVTAVNLDATNHHSLTDENVDDLIICVASLTGSDKTVTIAAGGPSALRSEIGDLVVTVQANERRYIRIETSRFLQPDGSIYLNLQSAFTGNIYALNPKGSH